MPNYQDRELPWPTVCLAGIFYVLALVLMVASLGWEYSRDTPLLNFVGFLIWDYGFAPYRDVFETSMPGTLAFHAVVVGLGLDGNLAFMVLANIIVLAFALLGARAIAPLGKAGAVIAVPLITVTMLLMGPGWILKIDMVVLVPISAALCLAFFRYPGRVLLRQFWIGALFGVATTMKPHFSLGAPVVVLAAFAIEHWTARLWAVPLRALLMQVAVSLLGFAVPVLCVAGWLVAVGAVHSFVFVLTQYLPLHLQKTDWQEFVTPEVSREIKRATTLRFGGYYHLVLAIPLVAILALACRSSLTRRQAILLTTLCTLAGIYGLAPGLGGQFYVYYYFPFFFFSVLLLAVAVSLIEKLPCRAILKATLILCLGGVLILYGGRFYGPDLLRSNKLDQVARIEAALIKWVPEGGRVQPIDWTSGVVHAMLRQKVQPATPYLYDYHFHHHVGSQINEGLRAAFIAALEDHPPEAVIEATAFPKVKGLNTSERFPQRDAFVATRYRLVLDDPAFRVYLRNDLVAP